MSCFDISIIPPPGYHLPALSTIPNNDDGVSSRRRHAVTIRPNRLTADTIPRTLETPNLSVKMGSRNTPRVTPTFATAAANRPTATRDVAMARVHSRSASAQGNSVVTVFPYSVRARLLLRAA